MSDGQMPLPYCHGSPTSLAAAMSMRAFASQLRWQVLAYIRLRGDAGCTCEEVVDGMGRKHQTISPRISELKAGGFLVDSQKTRKTSSGRAATVWVVRPI